jgi:predicted nucleic acid-binding protein
MRSDAAATAAEARRRLRASEDERLRLATALTAQTALAEDLQLQVCNLT